MDIYNFEISKNSKWAHYPFPSQWKSMKRILDLFSQLN